MPKIPIDYSKTIIYKIVCDDLSVKDCYVGHTVNMTKRKWGHKSACNNENDKSYNYKIYKIIRENGGWDNWNMLLVEKFPCKDKYEASKREREVYEELDAKMNMLIPYRTQEELKEYKKQSDKQYNKEHKEEIAEKKKQYNKEHKEEIAEKKKQYREKHKEKLKQYHKKYDEEHKEVIAEKRKQHYQEHKEQRKEHDKQYYQEHKEQRKEHVKQYYQEHKEKINEKIKEKQKEKAECEFCSKLLSKGSMSRHHKTCKSKPVKE